MNPNEAINVLVKCVELATTKGCYTLADTKIINQAIDSLVVPKVEPNEQQDATEKGKE